MDHTSWHDAFRNAPPADKPALLELRDNAAFEASHIAHATNFETLEQVKARLHELPPPAATIAITSEHRVASEQVADYLRGRGYNAFVVEACQHWPRTKGPSRALFHPAALLLRFLTSHWPAAHHRTALDLACGAGRDARFLAANAFHVTAVDRDRALLNRADALAVAPYYFPHFPCLPDSPTPGKVVCKHRTLGAHLADDAEFLRNHAAHLLNVVRFLRRGVLQLLHHAVLPDGYVVYEHFLIGCEKFGSPKKKSQMLQPGELRTVFSPQRGFVVVHDSIEHLPDGRPVARFIAHRSPT